jgi:succinate dehydrogenase flavin-adding protein (antitoxin of CptAB toxin-antitoxin module)
MMPDTQNQTPSEYSPYFWDVHIEELDLELHSRFIIERLLNEGDHHTLLWVCNTYSMDKIRTVVLKSRNLSRKTARYWQYYFNLKEEDMQCFGTLLTKTDNLF